jgi:hypothetical protein
LAHFPIKAQICVLISQKMADLPKLGKPARVGASLSRLKEGVGGFRPPQVRASHRAQGVPVWLRFYFGNLSPTIGKSTQIRVTL